MKHGAHAITRHNNSAKLVVGLAIGALLLSALVIYLLIRPKGQSTSPNLSDEMTPEQERAFYDDMHAVTPSLGDDEYESPFFADEDDGQTQDSLPSPAYVDTIYEDISKDVIASASDPDIY